jgi:hypothetical protein
MNKISFVFFLSQTKWSIVLDKRADIFMNLNGAIDEISIDVNEDEIYVYNRRTDSIPTVIHGNGPSKVGSIFLFIS